MTINQRPDNLSLVGNMKHLIVTVDRDVTVVVSTGGSSVAQRTFSPNGDGKVEIDLYDIVFPQLAFLIQNVSTPYQQTGICKTFHVTMTPTGQTASSFDFTALRAGVDRLADTAQNFLTQNFLTWQPNMKGVTYNTPEFLTYYAVAAVTIKCRAHVEDSDTTVTLATIPAGQAWTIPVGYAVIAGKVNGLPTYYDVWAENGSGERLTYIQRYYAQDMKSEQEQWVLFENSLGGIDTFRAYGDSDNTADHTHNVAEIEEVATEFRVDTTRKFKKNTGRLTKSERLWLLDFFPALRKYLYVGSYLRQIVVTESDVNYKASELPTAYSFTYKYADAKPYLNLPRTDTPQAVLNIDVPEVGSFTVAPRLVEFPRTQLSGGALFPVQDPYSEDWGSTTFAQLAQSLAEFLEGSYSGGGGTGHVHSNLADLENLTALLNQRLSKVNPDAARQLITFLQGVAFGTDGWGIDASGDATLHDVTMAFALLTAARSKNFASGLRGWNIDQYGNAEVESIRVRSTMEVEEMLINRQQAMEGDTLFTDNDQVTEVQPTGNGTYILTLKEKWDGYLTAQMYGNVIRGKINTLAAKSAGVSDYSSDDTGQERDNGENLYYTSWMHVIATHNTTPSLLEENQIQVALYGDEDVPSQKNFPPCEMMVIARWGCIDYSDPTAADYQAVKASIKRRQQSFLLSARDGRITKLTGVWKPILEDGNFGTTLGELPEWVVDNNWEVRERHQQGRDYLYAQGVVVGDFIKVNIQGAPIPTVVHVGDWVKGDATGVTPAVGAGIYLAGEFNETTQQYETHTVRHTNGTWKCLQHQPVTVGGVTTYHEPKWNSPYWQLIDGNGNKSIEFSSSNGYSFRRGAVNATFTPHLFYGNVEISNEIDNAYWSWERESLNTETGQYVKTEVDEAWDLQHKQQRLLTITNSDMPVGWSLKMKAVFTCKVSFLDGDTTETIDNQIIA